MSFVKVQHIFNAKSGLTEDGIVNSFYFLGPPPGDVNLAALCVEVAEFYDSTAGGDVSILSALHSSAFATNRHTMKCYDMNAEIPRAPLFEVTPVAPSPANSTTSNGMPHECAICLSYRSEPASGQIAARRRGRIYLGPLNFNALEESAPQHQVRPNAAIRSAILAAAVRFKAAAQVEGWSWVGFSPTAALTDTGPAGEFGVFNIEQLMVDDAFDTQRRRGERRTVVDMVLTAT